MATNWNAILSNTNNLKDIIAILKKVLANLEAKADITLIDEALIDITNVKTDVGEELKNLNDAVDQAVKNGLMKPFATEVALLASRPDKDKYAKAEDTKKIWWWGVDSEKGEKIPSWHDTGLSELERANKHAENMTNNLDRQTVKKFPNSNESLLVALTDAIGNRTWLEANAADGGLTELSLDHIFKAINAQFRISSSDDFFYALTDKLGFATDLTLDQSGQLAQFVVDRLAARIAEIIKIPEPEIIAKKPLSTMIYPNTEMCSIWGSSSANGYHAAMRVAAEELGYTDFYGGGQGSERMQQTCARFGSHPVPCTVVGGVIPASGTIDVKVDWEGTSPSGLKPFEGTLDGVRGTLAYKDRTTCTFTRTTSGAAVDSPDTYPFLPDARIYRDGVIILNLAKNNLSTVQGTFGDPHHAFKWTKEAYEYAKAFFKYVIILGHFVNNDGPIEAKYQTLKYNDLCEEYFEDRYVDIQNYFTSPQVWIDAGIEPTQIDLEQQAKGEKPESISKDIMHLNQLGSQLVVNKVKERLIQLNWSNNNA